MTRFLTILLTLYLPAAQLLQARAVMDADDEPRHMVPYPEGRCYMMRLTLRDKQQNQCSVERPEEFLSPRAIERRQRQHLKVDSTDLPISDCYLRQLREQGANVVSCSKWNNTVVVRGKSTTQMKALEKLPFVKDAILVWRSPDSIQSRRERDTWTGEFRKWDDVEPSVYGVTLQQTRLIGGEGLHDQGYLGEGMQIAVLDGGFMNVDKIEAFKDVSILGTADMVVPRSRNIYKEVDHGTKVLSTMAVSVPAYYRGTAPMAQYWLVRCEDSETEQLVEEDYWAAAAEWADSVGADIISTSVGYHDFDYSSMHHKYRDLDGHRTLISNSASMLASKGIVMVCSAGNDGMGSWKKINPPADAEHVITVGAVTLKGKNAAFSSIGPTADDRVKPDVMAVGSPAAVITGRGSIRQDMGTSFAAPQVAGLVACLWQKMPEKTALEIMDLVLKSGNNASQPDNICGYGVPDFGSIK